MRKLITGIVIALLLVPTSKSFGSVKIVPNTKCSYSGQTQIYSGKKYTCVKFGAKLVWNSGVKISPISSLPSAAYPQNIYKVKAIDADGYGWTVGKQAIGFSCWSGISSGDEAVLQVKKNGNWVNKQKGYLIRLSSTCTGAYPEAFFVQLTYYRGGLGTLPCYHINPSWND